MKSLKDIWKKTTKNTIRNTLTLKNSSLSDKSKEKVVFNLHNKNKEWFQLRSQKNSKNFRQNS